MQIPPKFSIFSEFTLLSNSWRRTLKWPISIPSDFWEFSLKDLNGIFKSEISLKAFLTFKSHVIRICLQENTFGSNPRQNIFEEKNQMQSNYLPTNSLHMSNKTSECNKGLDLLIRCRPFNSSLNLFHLIKLPTTDFASEKLKILKQFIFQRQRCLNVLCGALGAVRKLKSFFNHR